MKQRSLYVFETSHPIVSACYVILTLCLTMAAMQPVLIAISLLGAFAANCYTRGVRPTLTGLRWVLGLFILRAWRTDFPWAGCLWRAPYGLWQARTC